MLNILVVDDDPHIRKLIRVYLRNEGFEINEASDGIEAVSILESEKVDFVILDIMMPRMDGWELCKWIRDDMDIPVLMLSAKGEAADRIKGLQIGSDDYMSKPFDPLELLMRMKSLLKRYNRPSSHVITIGDKVELDRRTLEVKIGQQNITLPLKEFELLFKLANYPLQIFTKEQLIEDIWGLDYEGDDHTVTVHMNRLRKRFEEATSAFKITTIRGLGYKLEVTNV